MLRGHEQLTVPFCPYLMMHSPLLHQNIGQLCFSAWRICGCSFSQVIRDILLQAHKPSNWYSYDRKWVQFESWRSSVPPFDSWQAHLKRHFKESKVDTGDFFSGRGTARGCCQTDNWRFKRKARRCPIVREPDHQHPRRYVCRKENAKGGFYLWQH